MQHRASTEVTRKEGRRAAHGSKTPRQGRTPTRAKRKPAGSVAPGGSELFEQGLENGPAKDESIDDQHGASPPYSPRRAGCQGADRSQIWEYLTGPRSRRNRSASGSVSNVCVYVASPCRGDHERQNQRCIYSHPLTIPGSGRQAPTAHHIGPDGRQHMPGKSLPPCPSLGRRGDPPG